MSHTACEPVGNYALRLIFDDGTTAASSPGIFCSHSAREQETRWQAYLDELAAKGLHADERLH